MDIMTLIYYTLYDEEGDVIGSLERKVCMKNTISAEEAEKALTEFWNDIRPEKITVEIKEIESLRYLEQI